jgi:glycerol-3-phosphate acyltransferase PlsX
MLTIALDAMGGDHAPGPEIAGAIAAANRGLRVALVGDRTRLEPELAAAGAPAGIELVHASEAVVMADHPGRVYRTKPDSSLRVAMDLVASGQACALVSAGNSGAILAHGLLVLRRLEGVSRPAIVSIWPRPGSGPLILCDAGANVEVKPPMLAQFGILGACAARILTGNERPRVGLLANGTEAHKGTALTRAADELLRAVAKDPDAELEYLGYVEGDSIMTGPVDVVATDGFTGNVALKIAEGVSEAVLRMVRDQLESSTRAKLGAALVKPALDALRREIHPSEVGGAPLLGIGGLVVICHGAADALAIENAIAAAERYARRGLVDSLAAAIGRHRHLWEG